MDVELERKDEIEATNFAMKVIATYDLCWRCYKGTRVLCTSFALRWRVPLP